MFIICEDVREELNNKISHMGVFHNKIIFNAEPDEPMVTPLAIVFTIMDGEGEFNLRFEMENPKGEVKIQSDLTTREKDKNNPIVSIQKFLALRFSEVGEYIVRIFINDTPYESRFVVERASSN